MRRSAVSASGRFWWATRFGAPSSPIWSSTDFLQGGEAYKLRWTSSVRELFRLELCPPNLAGLLHRVTVTGRTVARRLVRGPAAAADPAERHPEDPER